MLVNNKFIITNNHCLLIIFCFYKNVLANDTNVHNHNLRIGFKILRQIITTEKECNEYKTLLVIWEMLPTYLGSFCCNENLNLTGSNKTHFVRIFIVKSALDKIIFNILAINLMFLLNLTESFSCGGLNVSINEHRDLVYTISSIIKSYQSTFAEKNALLSSLLQHFLTLIQSSNIDGNFYAIHTSYK